jgi:diguanylate cyclase (GGDEF)-like protein
MNHRREAMAELIELLRRSGFQVEESQSIPESQSLLAAGETDLVLLNPLVCKAGALEFEILEQSQQQAPVPVILLVEDLVALEQARLLQVPFRDFLLKPYNREECLHRIELMDSRLESHRSLEQRAGELEGQITTDFKTELLSERYFKDLLAIEFKRAQRHHTPLSLVLIDVDNFKGVNDSTEYAFGDEVLRAVAEALKQNIRETDFAARFGGDEFVLLLPHTSPAEAVLTAVRIRKKVSSATVESGEYSTKVTISMGIDTYDGRVESSPDELRRRANKALQEAKHRGKNQVWLYSGDGPEVAAGS